MNSVCLRDQRTNEAVEQEFKNFLSHSFVFSGIQSAEVMHLEKYFGAMKQWIALQDSHDCMFSLVDLHIQLLLYYEESKEVCFGRHF